MGNDLASSSHRSTEDSHSPGAATFAYDRAVVSSTLGATIGGTMLAPLGPAAGVGGSADFTQGPSP